MTGRCATLTLVVASVFLVSCGGGAAPRDAGPDASSRDLAAGDVTGPPVDAARDGSSDWQPSGPDGPTPDAGAPPDAGAASDAAPAPDALPQRMEAGPDAAPDALPQRMEAGPDAAPDVLPPPMDAGPGPAMDAPPAAGRYEVRVQVTTVPADGYSWIPVLVIGSAAGGGPALDGITLSLSRQNGGLLKPRVLQLTNTGGSSFFIPCSHADAGCLGTVRVQAALSSAPDVVVAQSAEITLVAPDGIGSPAACLIGPNVMFFDGNDYIWRGVMTVTEAKFGAAMSDPQLIQVMVDPIRPEQGRYWTLHFSSKKLGTPLKEQVYRGGERWPFEGEGRPGIDVSGDHRGCNRIAGDFQIHKLVFNGAAVQEFLASFDQHCEAGPNSLRGCIHYTAP